MKPENNDVDRPQWSKDFPINVGQDNYVARRDFTKFMVLTSFAFVVGQVWIGVQNVIRARRDKPGIRSIAKLADIHPGSSLLFNYPTDKDPCLLMKTMDDQLIAYSQKCTHLSCAVVPKLEERCMACPCHEGKFDMVTGRPISGPPRRPLPRITLQVRGGMIYATGVELSTI